MFTPSNTARFVAAPVRRTSFVHWLNAVIAAHKSRIALANLDAAARADVALTPAQVKTELARPLWDVPAAWKQ